MSFLLNFQLITGLNYQEHSNHSVTPFAVIDKEIANFNTIDPYASVVYISEQGLSINLVDVRIFIMYMEISLFMMEMLLYNFNITMMNSIKVFSFL